MRNKNKYIVTVIALVLFGSCDAPSSGNAQRQVVVRSEAPSRFDTNTVTTPTTTITTSTDTTSDLSIPSDATHCSWAENGETGFMHSATHLSLTESRSTAFTACQSSSNEDTIYFQLEEPITDTQLCFIPMHQQGSSSAYLGVPRCLNATDNKKIYTIRMYKDRPGFQNLEINSVMIMKDKSYSYIYPSSYITNTYPYPTQVKNILSPDAFLDCNMQLTNPNYATDILCKDFIQKAHYHMHRF